MSCGDVKTLKYPVAANATLEIALAQFWSSLPQTTLDVEVSFHGLSASCGSALTLPAATGVSDRVDLCATLERTRIAPSARLTRWADALRPAKSTIRPLGPTKAETDTRSTHEMRDVLDNSVRSYELVLEYNFTQPDSGALTLSLPMLNDMLYESPFESQLCMVFDQRLALLVFETPTLGLRRAFPCRRGGRLRESK